MTNTTLDESYSDVCALVVLMLSEDGPIKEARMRERLGISGSDRELEAFEYLRWQLKRDGLIAVVDGTWHRPDGKGGIRMTAISIAKKGER